MTMHVRDEADVIGSQLAYHFAAGVDFVIATDHASSDATRAILEAYADAGRLRLIPVDEGVMRAAQWRSRTAELAVVEHEADWVFSADADEFWWPRGGSLKDVLAAVPMRWGVVHAVSRHFAPRRDEDAHFAERMTARVSPYSAWTRHEDPYHLWVKIAHRAVPGLEVHFGGHTLTSGDLETLRGWYPIEVLHFPLRSLAQSRRKYLALSAAGLHTGDMGTHPAQAQKDIEAGTWDERYARYAANDVDPGGTARPGLTRDTRLRDALRQLAGVSPLRADEYLFVPPPPRHHTLAFPAYGVAETAMFWHDLQPFIAADSATRISDRHVDLDTRIHALERGIAAGLRRRLPGAARRVRA